ASVYEEQIPDQFDCPPERRFVGFDAFRKAVDALPPGGVVLLATPPAFRPMHVEYALSKGMHVFMEKSFGVDPPGIRRMLRNGTTAKERNLKISGGLMSRHSFPLQECVRQIHDGLIGEITTIRAYREHGPIGFSPREPHQSLLEHQIVNYSNFTWLNGSFMQDWLIHNLDVACWVRNMWPVSAQAQGGRAVRTEPDQLFDHYMVEYTFDDGTNLIAQGRHQTNTWGFFGDIVFGTKGCAVLGEGISQPKIYRNWKMVPDHLIWEHTGEFNPQYRTEHEILQKAIRNDTPHNETEYCCHASLTGLLGLAAAESGQEETWDATLRAEKSLADVDTMDRDSPAPVSPDDQGRYPIAVPGVTKTFR
ncbi:MAG: gfo/Idh/MocA family oxidoreductase, partial [Planctomycetia bacterium]|nr:gfo/Idh/MocA family oxidoreductase [Planctomycetia bacterium]